MSGKKFMKLMRIPVALLLMCLCMFDILLVCVLACHELRIGEKENSVKRN